MLQSIMPQPMHVPSPLATSSKFTLDHPLHAPLPYTLPRIPPSDRSDPALPALLSYASDDELVNSLHSFSGPDAKGSSLNPFNLAINWTSTIDPALAYLSLRSRPSFTPFLSDRDLGRNIRSVYEVLRPSGLHQRLVSDMLLRNPDPQTFATILELDAHSRKSNSFDNLRSSLVVALYNSLPDRLRTKLSRTTNLRIAKALIAQGETDLVAPVFHNLYHTTLWEPEGVWVLLSLITHLTRHQAVDQALPLLQHLIRQNRLPSAAFAGHTATQGDAAHPQIAAITVLSIVIRTVLSYRFYERSRQLSTELLGLLVASSHHESAWQLLLELCRASLAGATRREMEYVNETLSTMATIRDSPRLPKATTNDYVGSIKPRRGAGFYFGIPESKRPGLTSSNILRLAWLREKRVLAKLDKEVIKLDEREWEPLRDVYERFRQVAK